MKIFATLWRHLDRALFGYFDDRPHLTLRAPDDLRMALNFGTTLTTRLWLVFFSLSAGAQLILVPPDPPVARVFFWEVTSYTWAAALLISGLLMLWRTVTPKSRPAWGWISNALTSSVWGLLMWSKILHDGSIGLLGYYTFVWLMSAWVFVRTGATRRDMETT